MTTPYPDQFLESQDSSVGATPTRTLLVASTPRCGSHLLGRLLTSSGLFGVPLEYLHPENLVVWQRRLRTSTNRATLSQIQARRTSLETGIFSLKMHYSHLESASIDELRSWGLLPDLRVVHIFREDLVAQAVSYEIAAQSGAWIGASPPTNDLVYRPDSIRERFERLSAHEAAWRRHIALDRSPSISLSYEQLTAQPAEHLRRIAELLDVNLDESRHDLGATTASGRQASAINTRWCLQFRVDMLHDDRALPPRSQPHHKALELQRRLTQVEAKRQIRRKLSGLKRRIAR